MKLHRFVPQHRGSTAEIHRLSRLEGKFYWDDFWHFWVKNNDSYSCLRDTKQVLPEHWNAVGSMKVNNKPHDLVQFLRIFKNTQIVKQFVGTTIILKISFKPNIFNSQCIIQTFPVTVFWGSTQALWTLPPPPTSGDAKTASTDRLLPAQMAKMKESKVTSRWWTTKSPNYTTTTSETQPPPKINN